MSEEFMNTVREYRCLYDKGCTDFKDLRKKENAWIKVGEKFNLSSLEASKKYKNIRTTFTRYLASTKPPSGSGREDIILKPEYEHLRWLITHISHRNTTSNINIKNPEASSYQCPDEDDLVEIQREDDEDDRNSIFTEVSDQTPSTSRTSE